MLALSLWACTWVSYALTDGDSALFAAIGRDMAVEGGERWWVTQWAFQGEVAWFVEHPPGAFWPNAVLQKLGFCETSAPLLANALWLWLLIAALWSLAGPLAVSMLVLHYPMWKYGLRAGLEIPFTASVTLAFAAWRSSHRFAWVILAVATAAAFFTRGVFGALIPLCLLLDLFRTSSKAPPWRKAVLAMTLAALFLLLFDFWQSRISGRSFWLAYLQKQVFPSLETGGTPHGNRGSTLLYYGGRLLLYSFPWWALALWGNLKKKASDPDAIRLACFWLLVLFLAVIVPRRQGSRYLFAAFPAVAWLAAMPWTGAWETRKPMYWKVATLLALTAPLLMILGKGILSKQDAWQISAVQWRQFRHQNPGTEPIFGDFAPHDDRSKQFIRFHSGRWALRRGRPQAGLWYQPLERPQAWAEGEWKGTRLWLTDLGALWRLEPLQDGRLHLPDAKAPETPPDPSGERR